MDPKWCDENQRTRRNWSDLDISQALIIWTTSKAAYRYILKRRILPLPRDNSYISCKQF